MCSIVESEDGDWVSAKEAIKLLGHIVSSLRGIVTSAQMLEQQSSENNVVLVAGLELSWLEIFNTFTLSLGAVMLEASILLDEIDGKPVPELICEAK